jgi:hypothetical protein
MLINYIELIILPFIKEITSDFKLNERLSISYTNLVRNILLMFNNSSKFVENLLTTQDSSLP